MIDVVMAFTVQKEVNINTVIALVSFVFAGGVAWALLKFQGKLNERDNRQIAKMIEISDKKNEEFRKELDQKLINMKDHCESCREGFDSKYASKDLLDKEIQKQDALLLCYHALDVRLGKMETSLSFIADRYKEKDG